MNAILTTVAFFTCLASSGKLYDNQYSIDIMEAKYSGFHYVNKILGQQPKNKYLFVSLEIYNNTFSSHIDADIKIINPYGENYSPINSFIRYQFTNQRINIAPLQEEKVILVFDVPPLEKQMLQIKTPDSDQTFILTPHYLF